MHASRLPYRALGAAVVLLPLAAVAGTPHQKPGLWEVTSTVKMGGAGMPAMPQIPPETLEKMKQMGMQMPQMNANGMTHTMKMCVTPQQAANVEHPQFHQDTHCQMTDTQHSGDTFTGKMVCDSPQFKGNGEFSMTMAGDESYSGSSHMSGTANGHPMDMSTQMNGKWLGADCGSVKPFTPPKMPANPPPAP